MSRIHLIMPMGGKGSRFHENGEFLPKPLIEIKNHPFLYWSTISISKFVDVDITFVVLKEHILNHHIDETIKKYFPESKIVVIPEVLNGAVLTCMEGIKEITDSNPIIFNDCDHLFCSSSFNEFCKNKSNIDGGLLTFTSTDPKYSFLEMNEEGNVMRTVEKEAISNQAICGAYYFKNKELFLKYAKRYLENCKYNEYFVSGVYNEMAKDDCIIKNFPVDYHLAFGTPSEYEEACHSNLFERILK